MKEILLVDGNSVLFRAYYALMSRGNMLSSAGVPTNAVYGFSVMLQKAIEMIKPTHILVAFDTGKKTFRHDMFEDYKGTRKEVDEDLVSQFALVREFLDAYPILRYELDGYEADDIIGSIASMYAKDHVTILTSDKDLLQVVNDYTDVLLMKKGLTELDCVTPDVLMNTMGIKPKQIIDMKSMMGDKSDNIPGVPSVGEKTALKLLKQFKTLDGIYENSYMIRGKLGENIRNHRDAAYLSYKLATINCDINIEFKESDFEYSVDALSRNAFYRKYDMNSLVTQDKIETEDLKEIQAGSLDDILKHERLGVLVQEDDQGLMKSCVLSDGTHAVLVDDANVFTEIFTQKHQFVLSNAKALYRYLLSQGQSIAQSMFDDVVLLAFIVDGTITSFDKLKDAYNLWDEQLDAQSQMLNDANQILTVFDNLAHRGDVMGVDTVYETIEKPLISILAKCEHHGFSVDKTVLDRIAKETEAVLNDLSKTIYDFVGHEFNLNSPKQLATVLFDEMGLKTGKKRSTAVDVLEKLKGEHDIISYILQYRKYQKLYSTYAVGLMKHIASDDKIHTTLNQHLAQTGRLSSSNPNLQNISVRDEDGKMIRGAFVASKDHTLLSIDYSQIELRVLAFLSQETRMIEIFKEGRDIHEETAREIFDVDQPSSAQRREAKSVNFGIVYGMSEYGLAQQLDIPVESARAYIAKHIDIYPKIHQYMNQLVMNCQIDGYVETYFKRRRYIPEIQDRNYANREFGKRAAMNAPIQGTAADIIKLAMIQVDDLLENYESNMILQVHDELIFDVLDTELAHLQPKIVEIMEHIVDWPVSLRVSVSTGKTWME